MRPAKSTFIRKLVIISLSLVVITFVTGVVNKKANKSISEIAGVAIVNVTKFIGAALDSATAQTSNPYQNVGGNVGISGSVGIGTVSPKRALHVAATSTFPTLGTSNGQLLLSGTDGLWGMYLGGDNGTGTGWIQQMRNDSATAYNLILQPAGGNVGIGTGASPNNKLQVNNGTSNGGLQIQNNNGDTWFSYTGNGQNYIRGTTNIADTGGSVGIGIAGPNGKLDVYNSGNNGDGAVFAPDITTDNNFTIQTYIDANIGGGGWGGRTTYATGCCNNLALQPNVGTVSIGGTSTNYGSDKLTVHGNATFGGRIAFANNVWQTSADGYNRFHFTANSRSYFGSQDGYVWRNNADGDLMTLQNNGWLGVGMVPVTPFEVKGDGLSPNGAAFAVGGHNIGFSMSGQGTQRLCHSGADGAGIQAVSPIDCAAGGQVDLAEFYDTDGTLEPGDIVTIDRNSPSSNKVVKSVKANQPLLTGVVSTNPTADGILGFRVTSPNRQPIALAGRIPVKVSLENGPIKTGDPLVSSSIPGVAMKAGTEGGHIIGVAMENYDGTIPFTELTGVEENDRNTFSHAQDLPHYNSDPTKWPAGVGKIMVFMNLTDYNPDLSPASALNLKIKEAQNYQFIVQNENTGDIFDKIGAFAEIIVGKIQAGIIETKKLIVNGVDILEKLNTLTQKVETQQKEIDNLKEEINNLKKN